MAKASLTTLGLWDAVSAKVARAENPLLAVKMVASGDAPYAVVFTTDEPSAEVIAFYRDQCAQSEAVLATTPLSATPLGQHGSDEVPNVRWVVLHMIEETARHAGHLDAARELIDGTVRLGGR